MPSIVILGTLVFRAVLVFTAMYVLDKTSKIICIELYQLKIEKRVKT